MPTALIVHKELQIVGSMIYIDEVSKALDFLQSGRTRTARLTAGKVGLHPSSGLTRSLPMFSIASKEEIDHESESKPPNTADRG